MKTRTILLTLLLLALVFAAMPIANAFTWANPSVGPPSSEQIYFTRPGTSGQAEFYTQTGHYYTCITGTTNCGNTFATTGFSATDNVRYNDGPGGPFGCTVTGGTFKFSKNSNGLWTTPSTGATASVGGASYCAVTQSPVTQTKFIAFFIEATNTNLVYSVSTDGGSTWGTPGVVEARTTATTFIGSANSGAVAVSDSTWMVYIITSAGVFRSCRTTDSGTTWPCTNLDTGANTNIIRMSRLSAGKISGGYGGFGSGSTGNLRFITSDDNGLTYAGVTIDSGFTTAGLSGEGFAIHNATHYGASSIAACSGAVKFYSSTNGGITWASETATTAGGCANPQSSATTFDGQGNAWLTYCTNGPGTSCANKYANVFGATSIGSSATASVTGLVGFDVDPTGGIAIARTESGENIRIYNAQGLGTPVGGPVDTNCATGSNPYEDAVMAKTVTGGAGAQLVGFLNCTPAGDSEFFSIRQANGDVPTAAMFKDSTGETCTPGQSGTQCPYNIDLSQFSEDSVDNGLGKLGQVEDFPIDYSNNHEDFAHFDHRQIAWAFASQQCDNPPGPAWCTGTEPGMVGVAMFTAKTDPTLSNDENADSVQEHPSQDVNDFCLGKDAGSYYLAAVASGQSGRSWGVTFKQVNSGDTQAVNLDADISPSPGTFGASGGAIACGGGQIFQLDGASKFQLLSRAGAFVSETGTVSGANRGIAMSEEFYGPAAASTLRGTTCTTALEGTNGCLQFGVGIDGASAKIYNLTGGSIVQVGSLTVPSGTFKALEMDRTAQNVWIATSTTIARFTTTTVTTITTINTPGESNPTSPSSTGGFQIGDIQANDAFAPLGIGSFAGGILWAIGVIGGMTIGAGTIAGTTRRKELSWSWPFAVVGAVLGFFVSFAFGFLNTPTVFGIIVLGALGLGFRFYKSRASGGME
jgi:hypothetical protein